MATVLHIDGNEFHSASVAAKQFGYTREYLLMLAKQQKIEGRKVGNKWYVHLDSVRRYFANAKDAQEDRRRAISLERKRELREREDIKVAHEARLRRIAYRRTALVETLAVVIIGLTVGSTGYMGTQATQQASVGSPSEFINVVSLSLYRLVVPAPLPINEMHQSAENAVTTQTVWDAQEPVLVTEGAATIAATTEEAVAQSFSDIVRVSFDAFNPLVAIVTPIFRSGVGEPHRFMLMPVVEEIPGI